jgi:hypothetical protein
MYTFQAFYNTAGPRICAVEWHLRQFRNHCNHSNGCVIAQAVNCRLRITADGFSIPRLVTWDLWWTKWHWGRFPLPILIPANAPYSSLIRCWYNSPISRRRTKWTSLTPPHESKNKNLIPLTSSSNQPKQPDVLKISRYKESTLTLCVDCVLLSAINAATANFCLRTTQSCASTVLAACHFLYTNMPNISVWCTLNHGIFHT